MTVSIAELNSMPEARATALLADCCGASRWVSAMVARRPFGDRESLLAAADAIWQSLGAEDWREAFAHHPRIGEETGALPQTGTARAWSGAEQAGVSEAGDALRAQLGEVNRRYERRFGYIYIVSAAGRTAEDLLVTARRRLENEPAAELAIAAEEQRKITRNRLDQLLDPEERRRDGQ